MEAGFIPASRRGSTKSHGNLPQGGHLYRYQEALAGGNFRRKCVKAERNFKRAGFSVNDGSVAGAAVLRPEVHASHSEPIASIDDVAIIRQDVRVKACIAGSPPAPTVAQCLAKSSADVAHSPPPLASRNRSAQNASYRSQKKAHAAGVGGVAPNYNSIDELSTPPHFILRAGGENLRIRDIGPGAGRISTFGRERNIRSLARADT